MITDEVYVEIKLLKKHGLSLRKIAKEVGCAVNTVRRHLDDENLPRYDRKKSRVTKLSRFEEYLRGRQAAAHPVWIPASVLLREIAALGYTGGHSQLRAYMHGSQAGFAGRSGGTVRDGAGRADAGGLD